MYVRHEVKPGQVTFITLTYDESVDLAVIAASLPDRDSPLIQNEGSFLMCGKGDSTVGPNVEAGALCTLKNKKTGSEH